MQKDLTNKDILEELKSFPKTKDSLIKVLHLLQDKHPQQYISNDILDTCCTYFGLSKAEVYGLVSYYSMFSLRPRGKYHISLCKSPVCTIMGADNIVEHFKKVYNLSPGETSKDGLISLGQVECLGRCGKAPSMMINKEFYTQLTPVVIDDIITNLKKK